MGKGDERGKFYEKLVRELIAFAEHELVATRPTADGSSERDNVESGLKQMEALGLKPKQSPPPKSPPFPYALSYLWKWFAQLSAGRGLNSLGMAGAMQAALTWSDIYAWSQLTGSNPTPWEVDALRRLDAVYLKVHTPKSNG